MASSENTAINELIARVSGGPTSTSARMAAAVPPSDAAGVAEPRVSSSLPAQPALPIGSPVMRPPTAPPLPSPPYPPGMQVHGMSELPDGRQDHPMHTTLPVTMPIAAPFEAQHLGSPPGVAYGDPAVAQAWRSSSTGSEWIEPTQLVNPRHRERFVGTLKLRHSDLRITVGKLALTIVLLMGAGIFIGSYVVFSGEAGKPSNQAVAANVADPRPAQPEPVQVTAVASPAPAVAPEAAPAANQAPTVAEPVTPAPARAAPQPVPVAKVEPAPAANIEPVPTGKPEPVATGKLEPALAAKVEPTPAATPSPSSNSVAQSGGEPSAPEDTAAKAPMLVDVRIDSTPSGATVTLVDRGKSQFVGKTPVNATFDTSREYDLVFTFPNKATQQKHLNASTTRHVAVTLAEPPNAQPALVSAPISAPRHVEKAVVEKPPASPVRKPSAEPVPASPVKKPGKAAAEPVLGEGTLMVSSKPPCQIVIDGKPTGLTTPQRSITLPAGNHKVTLVNSEKDIKKTVSVQITANSTEKVIEDLMP